jgi:hypothetical protein
MVLIVTNVVAFMLPIDQGVNTKMFEWLKMVKLVMLNRHKSKDFMKNAIFAVVRNVPRG